MKYIFYILPLLSLVTSSCNSTCTSNKLAGNWYTCGPDGSYIEWYVKNDTYKFCTDELLEAQSEKYTISKDTLISQSPYKKIRNQVSKAIMHFKKMVTWNLIMLHQMKIGFFILLMRK